MSAAKLIELEPGFSVFASSALEARFVHKEIFLERCYDITSLPSRRSLPMSVRTSGYSWAAVCDLLSEGGMEPSAEQAPLFEEQVRAYLVRAVKRGSGQPPT